MTMTWREVVSAILRVLASQGGWCAIAAVYLQQHLLPVVSVGTFAAYAGEVAPTAAPEEFKSAVRAYLLTLADKMGNRFARVCLTFLVNNLSDALLDQVYDLVVGKVATTAMESNSINADLVSAAMEAMESVA